MITKMADVRNNKLIIIILLWIGLFLVRPCLAQEDSQRVKLIKQNIKSMKSIKDIQPQLEELLAVYAKDSRFNEFRDYLETLEKDKRFKDAALIYYYKTLTRFNQMRFLEENQMWEELFSKKNSYILDIDSNLEKAKKLSEKTDGLSLRLKFLEWSLAKYREQPTINILEELFNLAQEFSQAQGDHQAIKDIADALYEKEEINYGKKLYSIYVSGIAETDISQAELKKLADNFLKEDKVDLAASLYDIYLEKIISSPEGEHMAIREMVAIAEIFAHSGWQEGLDPFYAEKVYAKIESLFGKEVYSDWQYKRAYNLERSKEYEACLSEYSKLLNNFPKFKQKDRVYFRLGVIHAYIFNKIDKAREYLSKVIKDYPDSPDYINSLYNLGLLSQWQQDTEKAMKYYVNILEATKDVKIKPEIADLANARINEIVEEKDMEYNLRMFLEATLEKRESKKYIHLDLFAKSAKGYLNQTVKFQTNSYFLNTGCLQQDFTYLWSGQLGNNQNPFNELEFQTRYEDIGTKVVNVALVSPAGIVDGTIEITDIYQEVKEEQNSN